MSIASVLENKPKDLVTATMDMTVADAAKLLAQYKIGAVVVKDAGKMCGILSERDIVRNLAKDGEACLNGTVADIMTKEVQTTTSDVHLTEVLAIMTRGRFRHIPVMDGDDLIGIVSIGDIVKHRLQELESEANNLRQYVSGGY